jgi:hypothetical protein
MSKVVWFDDFNYSLEMYPGDRPEIAHTEYGIVSYQPSFSWGQVISGGSLQDTHGDGKTGVIIARWIVWGYWRDYRPNYFGVLSKKILVECSRAVDIVAHNPNGDYPSRWFEAENSTSLLVELAEPMVFAGFHFSSYSGPINWIRITTFDDELNPPDPDPPDPPIVGLWTDYVLCGER